MKSPPKPDARDVPASAAASVHTNGDATGIGYSARALIACGLGNARASESRIGCRRVPARLLKRSSKRDFSCRLRCLCSYRRSLNRNRNRHGDVCAAGSRVTEVPIPLASALFESVGRCKGRKKLSWHGRARDW